MFGYLPFEPLAHYIRGMATMFFLVWAVITYSWRKRDRMTLLLFVAVSYVAFGYVKDVVFLFNPLMKDAFVENLVGILDVTSTPLVSAFFLEATAPGTVSVRRLTLSYLLFAAFVPLYRFCPVKPVLFCAYLLSAITALLALVVVPFNVVRYNKTFYDYINEYCVAEACRIMEESTSERLPMADVAARSGFNSNSSFNRYFCKIKGDTPARYYRKLGGGEMSN